MKGARRAAVVLAALLGASATAAPSAVPLAPVPQPSPSPGTRTTRALLIGIDRYVSDQLKTLHGCVNDVERMRDVLVGRFRVPPDNIKVLKDDEATRDAILEAIRTHLLAPANDGDVLILHFSGHGAQAVDDSGDEPDGLDETIVPHDSRVGTVFDITDDEINERLAELTARTPNVIFILDSCHSGAASKAADLGTSVRQAPTDMRQRPRTAPPSRGLMEGPNEVRPLGARYVMISGSLPNELSNEGVFPDGFDGALTHALTEALKTAPERTTYRDVMDAVKTKVTARFPSQHPQLEGAGLDTVVFGTEQLTARPFVLVEPTPDGKLQIAAGEIHGLTPGTVLRVYAPGTKDFAGATVAARARITSVQPFSAVAEVQGAGTVEEHSRAVLDAVRSPGFRAGVFLDGVDASTLLKAVRLGLSEYDLVREVKDPAEAQLRLRVADGQARLSNAEGEALGSVPDVAASADDLVGRVLHWAQWYALLSLEGQSPGLDVDLRIEREGPGATWEAVGEEVSEGTKLQITATNKSSTPLFLVLLDLTTDGAVQPLRPQPGQPPEAVSPGKSITLQPMARLKQGAVRVTDVLKVIATTAQVPADTFALGVAKRGAPLGGDAENPMARYLRLAVEGRARDMLEPVQVDEWMTRQRTLRVSRPSARARSFAAHYAAGTAPRAVEDALRASTRAVCTGPDRARCYEAVPSVIDDSIVEVLAPTQRDPAAPPPSVGRAFEEAYALQAETRALRVEPLFEVDLPAAARPPEARDSLMRSATHDPRAQADPRWSLKHVRAPEAWAALQALGRPAGAEAKGIAIAHPDTGYRPHPEIWDAVPDRRPVWAEKGHDYVDDDADATDPLVKDGLLDNPGHGTGSGSAIVSPADCQLAGATQCPTGVAPGARLVPLRVHKSVVHFDTKQMSEAIADASGDDRTRVGVATSVMSISMGGVPSWTLWRAVTNAEKRGYLIVAAAGNYVHTVVWPARFDSTIAVAATNVGCRPWAHTSAGSAVDISAPGESVWRGAVERDGTFTTGMGSGTTFATATVAGVAALWMARYAATPEFQALRNEGRVTETFRRLLQETAWKPGAVPSQAPASVVCDDAGPWNTGLMGAGIADAAALLAKPLPTGGPRAAAVARSLEDLPLFATLYPVGTPRETVWADYRRLFTAGPDDSALGGYESEVMFHYAQSRDVAIALDRVVEAGDRSDGAFTQASEALRGADLSQQLRGALRR